MPEKCLWLTVKLVFVSCLLFSWGSSFSSLSRRICIRAQNSVSKLISMDRYIRDEIEEGYDYEDELERNYDHQGQEESQAWNSYAHRYNEVGDEQREPNSFDDGCDKHAHGNYECMLQSLQQNFEGVSGSLSNEDFPGLSTSSLHCKGFAGSEGSVLLQRSPPPPSSSSPWVNAARMPQRTSFQNVFNMEIHHRGNSEGPRGKGNELKKYTHNNPRHEGRGDRDGRGGQKWFSPKSNPIPCSDQPLLITIGPVCSGKTTYLKNYGNIIDIAIDDAPNSYRKMKIDDILLYSDSIGTNTNEERIFKQKYCERLKMKTLYERYKWILRSEQVQLLLLLADKITVDEFIENMQDTLADNFGGSTELCEMFIAIVLEIKFKMTSDISTIFKTKTIDIFCKGDDYLFVSNICRGIT